MHRQPFDIRKPLVAARSFTFAGEQFAKGDPFPIKDFSARLVLRQYEALAINHAEPEPEVASLTPTMTGPKGGRYTITIPGVDEPEIVRGKANAEARLAELIAEADQKPVGQPEPEPEPELEAERPAADAPLVVVTDDGVTWTVSAPWLEGSEEFDTAELADARRNELIAAGAPEGWEPEASDASGGENTAGEGGENAVAASDTDKDEGEAKTPPSE